MTDCDAKSHVPCGCSSRVMSSSTQFSNSFIDHHDYPLSERSYHKNTTAAPVLTQYRYQELPPQPPKITSMISSRMPYRSVLRIEFYLTIHQVLWKVCHFVLLAFILSILLLFRRISSIDYSKEKDSAVIHFEKPSAAKTASMVSNMTRHCGAADLPRLAEWWYPGRR